MRGVGVRAATLQYPSPASTPPLRQHTTQTLLYRRKSNPSILLYQLLDRFLLVMSGHELLQYLNASLRLIIF